MENIFIVKIGPLERQYPCTNKHNNNEENAIIALSLLDKLKTDYDNINESLSVHLNINTWQAWIMHIYKHVARYYKVDSTKLLKEWAKHEIGYK